MSEKSPAFQLYASDFLAGTAHHSDAEVGLYIRCLLREWLDGSLPAAFECADETIVELLPRDDPKRRRLAWKSVSRHFKDHPELPNRIIQPRLESVRDAQRAYREKQVASSQKGVAARRRIGQLPPAGGSVWDDDFYKSRPSTDQPAIEPTVNRRSTSSVSSLQSPTSPSLAGDNVVPLEKRLLRRMNGAA